MRELHLTRETEAVLTRIRTYPWTLSAFGMSPSRACRLVEARVERRINVFGVVLQERNAYRRYVHEVVKSFRTQTGPPLARALELVIRKWADFGLNPALLQGLLSDCFLRFEQTGYAQPWSKPLTWPKKRGPKPRRVPRRSYEQSLRRGRTSLGSANTVEEQSAGHRAGSGHAAEIATKLRPVLNAAGVPGERFVSYYAFAQKLGSLSRNYSARSLQMAAADLVDLYEAKALDREALLSIAAAVFGLTDLT
jgi:hypothetical protein